MKCLLKLHSLQSHGFQIEVASFRDVVEVGFRVGIYLYPLFLGAGSLATAILSLNAFLESYRLCPVCLGNFN